MIKEVKTTQQMMKRIKFKIGEKNVQLYNFCI